MSDLPSPPIAPARPTVLRHGDDERVDDWYWLNERDDPEVTTYLEAENAYTEAAFTHIAPLRERIYDEIVARVQETDASTPVARGPWEYFTRTVEGLQYPVHCRRPRDTPGLPDPTSPPGAATGEQVILDENAIVGDGDYLAVGDIAVSPDHSTIAYSIDRNGSERYELRFRRAGEAVDLGPSIPNVYYGVAWANDDATVYYVRPDDAVRPWQVWRHVLGTDARADELVYEDADERFYVTLERSRTGHFVVVTSASKITSEVHLVDADDPRARPVVVEPRRAGVEYHVDHHTGPAGSRLYVLTNEDGAENFRLMVAPISDPGRASWTEVLPADPAVRIDDVEAFAGHLVLSERAQGLERLRLVRLGPDGAATPSDPLPMPDEVYSVWTEGNPEFDTTRVRYHYTSLVHPTSVFHHDVATDTTTLVRRQPVPGYEPDRYESHREWATAPDGVRVPISIVHRRDVALDGSAPMLLYGYGSYEVSIDPTFSASRVSLLDRGAAFAIAHVRGGGELGRHWYESGKLARKTNTFTDFIACAEHLVRRGYTSPARLAARGGSAGGLLMGAVANLRPDLFRAIVAEVPFVDALTTMLDETLPLTVTEWEEWGDPVHDPDIYALMRSYSPVDNVRAQDYPAILATAGLNDPRVQYWEPAKWVARLRHTNTGPRPILLKTEMGAGHGGPSGRYDAWRDEAFVLSFVLDQLDVAEPGEGELEN